jgi:hypothetical protein
MLPEPVGWAYYGEQFLEYVFGPRVTLPNLVGVIGLSGVAAAVLREGARKS